MVICLEQGANNLHMVQLMPLPPIISCYIKIQNSLPLWCRVTLVVLENRPLNRCTSSSVGVRSAVLHNIVIYTAGNVDPATGNKHGRD